MSDSASGKLNEIATVSVSYDDPVSGKAFTQRATPVVVGYTKDNDLAERSIDQVIAAEAAIFANAEETEKAIALADQGDVEGSRRQLDGQLRTLNEAYSSAPAAQQSLLKREIEAITGAREELESDQLSKEQRKALTSESWKLRNAKRSSSAPVNP